MSNFKNSDSVRKEIQERLFALQDLKYKEFQAKLIPTVTPEHIIGVRTPELRKLAKELSKTPEAVVFMENLPHVYYDENTLHGCLIELMKDYQQAIEATEAFLPYIDNWATCDMISPKVFAKHPEELYERIQKWVGQADQVYEVRFGVGMLLKFYLDENFLPEHLDLVATIRSEEYYINMMIAWYFATALAKQYETTLPYIEQKKLAVWTHNKAIQKAVESRRITDEQKAYLKSCKLSDINRE